MVSLSAAAVLHDDVTLVTARVHGDSIPRRVRLADRLGGPVWPPRREGVPVAGWDEDGFEGVVPAEDTLALGYASPAPPADPPVEIAAATPIRPGESRDAGVTDPRATERPVTTAAAIRELGDPAPPRDAVPVPTRAASAGSASHPDGG